MKDRFVYTFVVDTDQIKSDNIFSVQENDPNAALDRVADEFLKTSPKYLNVVMVYSNDPNVTKEETYARNFVFG